MGATAAAGHYDGEKHEATGGTGDAKGVEPTERALAGEYRPLLMRLDLLARRQAAHHQLSRAQTSMLSTLATHGELRMGDLARLENIRVPTASNLVTAIEATGLVERVRHDDDKRGVSVRLTPTGRAEVAEAVRARDAELAERLSGLDPEQRETLAEALPALHALLDQFD